MSIVKYVKKLADKLITQQGTTDPDALLKSNKNITMNYRPMGENINGLYSCMSEKEQILSVNDSLQGLNRQYACFHELGHVEFKHKGQLLFNCPETKNLKEEYEADLFATYMIIKHNGITRENIEEFILPRRVAELVHKFL